MRSSRRGAAALIVLGAAVVFLGIEVIQAALAADAVPATVRFAAVHTVGVVMFGILSLLAVIAAVVLSARWFVVLVGVWVAAAAAAVLLS